MTPGAIVLAYHACDVTVRDALVKRTLDTLTPSHGDYDWLGDGVYFFENDPNRADHFAQEAHEHPERLYSRQPIATPAVVGAIICAHRWLDLSTQLGIENYEAAYESLLDDRTRAGKDMPVNEPAFDGDTTILWRKQDCAVFNVLHQLRKDANLPSIQVMRAAFYQGDIVDGTSEFREFTHVQLAVRDLSCIIGWFVPPGGKLMTEAESAEAERRLDAAKQARTAGKKRVRA